MDSEASAPGHGSWPVCNPGKKGAVVHILINICKALRKRQVVCSKWSKM